MTTQFIINDKGEKTAAIIPITEYDNLLHKPHLTIDIVDDYKEMIDKMLSEDDDGTTEYSSFEAVKNKFLKP